jgi:1-pyrroline-5-carboxylate dehydrogenase
MNGQFKVPTPVNEPIRAYGPGSPEKIRLKAELERQHGLVKEVPLVIGGKRYFDRPQQAIYSPHERHHQIATLAQATEADTTLAIETAVAAQKDWARLPWHERASVFFRAATLLTEKYRDRINASTMLAQGKNVFQAEVDAVCEMIDFLRFNGQFAQQIYEQQPFYSPPGQWNRSEARGLEGFVFAVGPFNFTSISVNLATAPALMGCSVLWKPAPEAMLASYYALEMLEEAGLPPGVINLVYGDAGMIGGKALDNPNFAGLHFTGSTQTFQKLWHQASSNLDAYRNYPRLVGETGGKDFVFAHPSADVDALVTALIRGAFEYQGQKCSAASRAYIPASIWKRVKTQLVDEIKTIRMGTPLDFRNFVNAVIHQASFTRIEGYLEHAKQSPEVEILCGGNGHDKEGFFIEPTILHTTNPRYRSMIEEIFGPVLSIYVYPDAEIEETLTLCDTSTPYALTGAIFAQDQHAIHALSRRLTYAAGNFYVNDKPTGAVVGQQPFGGSRKSGTNDKAGSMYNLLRWTTHRTVKENHAPIVGYRYPFLGEA